MFSSQPFVRFLIPLIGGIAFTQFFYELDWLYSSIKAINFLWVISMVITLLLLGQYFFSGRSIGRSTIFFSSIFCLGTLTATLKIYFLHHDFETLASFDYDGYVLEIKSLGQKKRTVYQFESQLIAIHSSIGWSTKNARVLVSITDKSSLLPSPGSRIVVKKRPINLPKGAMNPEEFDYRRYLEKLGIVWTVYLNENSFVLLPDQTTTSFYVWPSLLSQQADAVFRKYLKADSSYGLIKAMLLGRRGDLGNNLLDSYISAGAIHVLAVSGLHVGVLFLLLSTLFGQLRKTSWGRLTYLTLIVFFLLIYAVMTGLTPSVVRASLMCVTFAVSQTFLRRHDGLNSLALSAFIILLLDPFALYSVGFQLSYAAVLGILLIYPIFKNSFESPNLVLSWLWQITLIGFVAQLFTFPLSIHYFHQFPIYFWLVNPFVIALTTVLIYGAVGMLLLSFQPFDDITKTIALVVDFVAAVMNRIVHLPRHLPGYLLENLNLDLIEVILIIVVLCGIYLVVKYRDYTKLKLVLLFGILFFYYSTWKLVADFTNSDSYFHSISRHSVLTFTEGQIGYIISDNAFRLDTQAYVTHLKNYFISKGIREVKSFNLPEGSLNHRLIIGKGTSQIGWDTQQMTTPSSWIIIRNKLFPGEISLPKRNFTHFILSPELGYKTKERWKEVFHGKSNAVLDPIETGAVNFH